MPRARADILHRIRSGSPPNYRTSRPLIDRLLESLPSCDSSVFGHHHLGVHVLGKTLLIGIACMTMLGVVGDLMNIGGGNILLNNSILRSAEARDRPMGIYDELLTSRWPIPYEELDLDTSYGTVHVIASGPEEGEPALLFHASGMSATSWAWNVEAAKEVNRGIQAFLGL